MHHAPSQLDIPPIVRSRLFGVTGQSGVFGSYSLEDEYKMNCKAVVTVLLLCDVLNCAILLAVSTTEQKGAGR